MLAIQGQQGTRSLVILKVVLHLSTRRTNNLRERIPRLRALIKRTVIVSSAIRRETWLGIVLITKKVQSSRLLKRRRSLFPSPTLRQ